MRMPGLPGSHQRRARAFEYALVIVTAVVIIGLAIWFVGQEFTAHFHAP